MRATGEHAATVCNVTPHYFNRFAKAMGLRPDRHFVPGEASRKYVWGVRHVLAVQLVPALERVGVPFPAAVAFARGLVDAHPSDEAIEAALTDRPYVLIAGNQVCPFTVDLAAVQAADSSRGELLKQMGLSIRAVDTSVLWSQVRGALLHLQTCGETARQE